MENRNNDPKSVLMIITSMMIFGSIGLFRRNLPLSSGFLALFRGLAGGLLIFLFMRLKNRNRVRMTRRQLLGLALSGAFMGINWILLFEAYNYTSVAVATLCYYMQPTIVILLSPLIFRERLTVRKGLCAAVAVAGMFLISGAAGSMGEQGKDIRGMLLGLGAAVFYACVVILNKKISGIDAYPKTTVQLFSAGIAMIPYLLLTGGFPSGGFDTQTIVLLLILGVVHTGIAYVLYFGSLDGLRAQSAALFSYADPLFALLFSVVFLREPLAVPVIIGAALIIGSAVISEADGKKR